MDESYLSSKDDRLDCINIFLLVVPKVFLTLPDNENPVPA